MARYRVAIEIRALLAAGRSPGTREYTVDALTKRKARARALEAFHRDYQCEGEVVSCRLSTS